MQQPPETSIAQGTNRDFAAVAGLFIANGLAVGVLGGSLPGLRAHLSLGPGHIVGVLVAAAVVAVFSMNLSGALSDRHGARMPALVGGTVMAGGAVLMGLAPDYRVLILGAALWTWGTLAFAYSTGDRAGVLLKFSKKGWICKTYEGQLALYVVGGVAPQIWDFSTRDEELAKKLGVSQAAIMEMAVRKFAEQEKVA